jgi:hypothetical protein
MNLSAGGQGGSTAARIGAAADGYGHRKILDAVCRRPLELLHELPGIGREGLQIPPLALCIKRVEGQAAFSAAADAADDHELAQGQIEVDALEIMHLNAAQVDVLGCHAILSSKGKLSA